MPRAARVLGVIHLKDIVKDGLRARFAELRAMGIRTVMITGDNPLTARAIAKEAGVDDFLAEATPEDKLALIQREQEGGSLVAMTGDGTNDAPALAQADVGVAMNTGTSAAKEAGNMVDLDCDPTKLIDIVRIGKQLLITRGALTTFSLANDIAKYFAIIPAMFMGVFPGLAALNIMQLQLAGIRRHERDHLQRDRHRRADPARAARREATAPAAPRRSSAATCSSTGSAASSPRSSASSSSTSSSASSPASDRRPTHKETHHVHRTHHRPYHRRRPPRDARLHRRARRRLHAAHHRHRPARPALAGERLARPRQRRRDRRQRPHRAVLRRMPTATPLPEYFQSRPSAAATATTAPPRAARTWARRTTDLVAAIEERQAAIADLRGRRRRATIPADAVTASALGPRPAHQPRVRPAPGRRASPRRAALAEAEVRALVEQHIQQRDLGYLGEPRVNVLELNLALDALAALTNRSMARETSQMSGDTPDTAPSAKSRARRGRLRVLLGAAPGVGKTYEMLEEGRRLRADGRDVVIGIVETHGRAATAAQADGLPVVARRTVTHRGVALSELDVDAVMARHPEIALVDELAHTNAPGSRNAKRWQDVDELLDAGIDVITTVNVQHIESLNDVVEQITGIAQRETIPDAVVRAADQIEVVDLAPQSLRDRLAAGLVYPAERIDAALSNYFRLGNLTALRELALLWLADEVDSALKLYRAEHGIEGTWQARERVVVALTGGPEGETLIRRGARIAARSAGGELLAVHVSSQDGLRSATPGALAAQRALVESLGGTYHQVVGDDVPRALVEFARSVDATQLVIGVSRRGRVAAAPDRRRHRRDRHPRVRRHRRPHRDARRREPAVCTSRA